MTRVDHNPTPFNGWADPANHVIQIDSEPYLTTTYAVALHEFGHALGLKDLPEGQRGVIDPRTITTEFSDDDMAECRRVGAC